MKTILVPIDFSSNSILALHTARKLAKRINARLVVLHVYQHLMPMANTPESISNYDYTEDQKDILKRQLAETVEALNDTETEIVQYVVKAEPKHGIDQVALKVEADLIVMGRTGKGSLFDKLIGSLATDVAMEGVCPVLIVPPQFDPKPLQEVVYATQLQFDESMVLDQVVPLMKTMGGRLTFLKIDSLMQANRHEDQDFIKNITERYQFSEEDIVIKPAGDVVGGIEEYCQTIQADLLVVSARKRGLLASILGERSVTKKLILETQIPLLVYRLPTEKA